MNVIDITNKMKPENLNIKPNQNLIGLIVGLASVGIAEYFCLNLLFCLGTIVTVLFLISICFTLYFYTLGYCKKRGLDS